MHVSPSCSGLWFGQNWKLKKNTGTWARTVENGFDDFPLPLLRTVFLVGLKEKFHTKHLAFFHETNPPGPLTNRLI